MTVNNNITEDIPYDLSVPLTELTFELTNTAYDIVIDDLPFIVKVDNQNPYRRETAPYKKDQFDNSPEPGEQSLTGWWLRSQTSWHSGAGIEFYEPGTEPETVTHKFYDSRGVDVWTVGEIHLHKKVFHAYSSASGAGNINAATGNDGTNDVLISGDAKGILRKVTFSGNSSATTANYVAPSTSFPDGHDGTNHPFHSVTTDGNTYYAACDYCIHKGTIGTLASDDIFFKHSDGATGNPNVLVKYAKGNVFVGMGRTFGLLRTEEPATNKTHGASGGVDTFTNFMNHVNTNWNWVDATGSPGPLFFAGNGGNNGEVWSATIDRDTTVTTSAIALDAATMVISLPDGELVKAIHYYLGFLVIGTNKGVRVCPVDGNGNPVLGPLLVETSYSVNGFAVRGTYLYAATKVLDGANTNAILIRIDLSQQFNDGTFAYAYDLEYESSLDGDSSECTEVYDINDRIVMVVQEESDISKGELQVEHTTDYRTSGWLQTGKIRYGTIEPKFFRYINVQCTTGQGDTIQVYTINKVGTEVGIATLSQGLSNQDVFISNPTAKQEWMSFKFVLNNVTTDQDLPVLEAYQVKATPATRRQRLYQYPLSCYDSEMDRFNSVFGYSGRAMEYIQRIETIEETGRFVNITDYRTGEQYSGVIEEVRFINESSPDKDGSGFGGLLLITVRKM